MILSNDAVAEKLGWTKRRNVIKVWLMHCHICTMIAFHQLFVEIYKVRMDCQIQSMKLVLLILELPSSLSQTHPIGQNLQARMDILRQARTLFKLVKYTSESLLDYQFKKKSNFLFVFPLRAYIHTESCKKVWHAQFWIVSIGSDEGKASKTFYFLNMLFIFKLRHSTS